MSISGHAPCSTRFCLICCRRLSLRPWRRAWADCDGCDLAKSQELSQRARARSRRIHNGKQSVAAAGGYEASIVRHSDA